MVHTRLATTDNVLPNPPFNSDARHESGARGLTARYVS